MRFGLIKFKTDYKGNEVYVWDAKRRRWVDDNGLTIRLLYRILAKGDTWIIAELRRRDHYDYTFALAEDAIRELNLWDYVTEWIEANSIAELPSVTNTTLEQVLKDAGVLDDDK
ncbi:MAG: hypothetical protein RXQ94_00450 [Caldivirga sp.]